MAATQTRHFSNRSTPTSLADTVADTIRQQLILGELRAGQHLSEAALSQQLDISRNTLRVVFRILIKEGLLRHEPNRGVAVVVPSIADIIDIYRVRRLIEFSSAFYTLHPGDVVYTGTPEGVGPIRPGDLLTAEIERIGKMDVHVR